MGNVIMTKKLTTLFKKNQFSDDPKIYGTI